VGRKTADHKANSTVGGDMDMFERFTDRARKVLAMANQEAIRFNHEYIGTEHILLGLVKEGSGVGANVLKNLNVDLRRVRLEVEKIITCGPVTVTMNKLPQTPRARKIIEYAIEESKHLVLQLRVDVLARAASRLSRFEALSRLRLLIPGDQNQAIGIKRQL
jgi:ATP-dependent Clp protease ATP-binding subunit ClpA